MANDYVFFDPRKKAQQEAQDEKVLTEKEEERLRNVKMGEQAVKTIADFIRNCNHRILWCSWTLCNRKNFI